MRDICAAAPTTRTTLSLRPRLAAHLPEIYPVGVLLGARAVTDPEAAEVFHDRMIGGLHTAYRTLLERLAVAGHLAPGLSAPTAPRISAGR